MAKIKKAAVKTSRLKRWWRRWRNLCPDCGRPMGPLAKPRWCRFCNYRD